MLLRLCLLNCTPSRWQSFSTEAGDQRAVQTSAGISLGKGSNRPLATGAFRCEPFTSQNFQSDWQEPGEKLSLKKIHSIQNQAFLAQQTDRFSSCKKIIPPKQVLHGMKGHFAVQAVGLERNWGRLGLYYCRTHASTEKGQNSTVMFKPPTILLPTPWNLYHSCLKQLPFIVLLKSTHCFLYSKE